jgi:ABC-type sulfate/molybdate transport systems ATPase subunit
VYERPPTPSAIGNRQSAVPLPPTTIFITHHVEELPPATSQVLLLRDGGPAALGTPAEVLTEAVLSAVYGCPLSVRRTGGRWYVEVHPDAWQGLLRG